MCYFHLVSYLEACYLTERGTCLRFPFFPRFSTFPPVFFSCFDPVVAITCIGVDNFLFVSASFWVAPVREERGGLEGVGNPAFESESRVGRRGVSQALHCSGARNGLALWREVERHVLPSPAAVALECGYSLLAWRAVVAGGAASCTVPSRAPRLLFFRKTYVP